MFDYDEFASEAAKVLDKYDLREEIARCRESGYTETYEAHQYISDLCGAAGIYDAVEALENLSLDEFREYLSARYGVKWYEIITYEMQ